MSAIAARRELLVAAQTLAKTNTPTPEHYANMLSAIATVYFYDTDMPCDCVLVQKKEPKGLDDGRKL